MRTISDSQPTLDDSDNARNSRAKRTRVPGSIRRRQIAEATIRVVARTGVRGASTAKIAEEVGVSEATLYRHFASREEMILAAVDAWFDGIRAFVEASEDPNAVQWLMNVMHAHLRHFGSHDPDLSRVFLEFAAAEPGEGVADHMYRRQAEAHERLVKIVEAGRRQGRIRADVDPDQATWQLVTVLWADQLLRALNPDYSVDSERTSQLFQQVIRSITADPAH